MAENSSASTYHVFTDLMTSLVVILVLLLVLVLQQMSSERQAEELKAKVVGQGITRVSDQLVTKLKTLGLTLVTDPDDPEFTRVVRLDENAVRFEVGKDILSQQGESTVRKVAGILGDVICDGNTPKKIESLIIEGHTDKKDDDTVGGKLRNVDLSQRRAFAVMAEAFHSLDANRPSALECFRRLARATGRGSAKPIGLDDDLNRRVEIKIRFRNKLAATEE